MDLNPGFAAGAGAHGVGGASRSASQGLSCEHAKEPSQRRYSRGGVSGEQWASMQEQMRLAEYQFTWQVRDGTWAYRAPNRAQGLDVALDQEGLVARGYTAQGEAAWQFGLRLAAYGAQSLPAAIPQSGLSAEQARVTYRWNAALSEWFANTPQGVEHGLTLYAAPNPGELTLGYVLSGDLRPELDGNGGLILRNAGGAAVLVYDHWVVYDANGRQLPVHVALVAGGLRIRVEAAGAVHPLTVEARLHSQTAVLHASDAQADDEFGYSVAVSADVIVVGASGEDGGTGDPLPGVGAAYVFQRTQSGADGWGEVKILRASDAQAGDSFGYSVAVSGDVIVVGAPYENGGAGDLFFHAGAAYVFQRTQGGADGWGEVQILHASDAQGGDSFGCSVAVSGDVIVVGAPYEDGGAGDSLDRAGAAYVFQRTQGGADGWGEVQLLRASDAQVDDNFGASAVSDYVIVVGAPNIYIGASHPVSEAGAAYVFQAGFEVEQWEMKLPIVLKDFKNLSPVGHLEGSFSAVDIAGNYAYVLSTEGLHSIDVSNPHTPAEVGSYLDLPDGASSLNIVGDYAYTVQHDSSSGGLYVLDISDPALPGLAKFYDLWADNYPPNFAYVKAPYTYVIRGTVGPKPMYANTYDIQILDTSQPLSITVTGAITTGVVEYDLFVYGDSLYTAWTHFEGYPTYRMGFAIYDISDPANDQHLSSYLTKAFATGVSAVEGTLYTTLSERETLVVDVTNPYTPTVVYTITEAADDGFIFDNELFLYGGDAIYVYDLTNPAQPLLDRTYAVSDVADLRADQRYLYAVSSSGLYIMVR